MKATDLRKDIYRILDQVLESGRAVEVERNGKLIRISPADGVAPVDRLRPIPGLIVGDPAALEHIDWTAEWKP
ncbi:MAG: type II toxin-antitoxin system Phd/YefM family antitoxin [Deltaproteobacteria bacterium]|nr:type II toxin-antitoxin system Phd/YefM family antitoxin [Deltaproteobacteria bacterium]